MTINYAERAQRYLVLVEGGPPSNFGAWSPDVPGCVATGDSFDECVQNMREAIASHIEVLDDYGDPIPEPMGPGIYVERSAA